MSKADSRKKPVGNAGTSKFLNDLDTISKSLYSDKTQPTDAISIISSRSKSVRKPHLLEPKTKLKDASKNAKDSFDKDKKSIWSWKGIKALTHVRNRRFNCRFSVQIHSIEGLPAFFDDASLIVHWKRRDGELMTCPVRVCGGVAEFQEQLSHLCSVYGSRSGSHHSAKYEAKHFLLYVSVYNAPELDLGKHRVDLTRLLPLTLEELEEEKSSGKWTTSFRLSGKARGGTMNVSFGYAVIGSNSTEFSSNNYVSTPEGLLRNSSSATKLLGQFDQMNELSILQTGSLPAKSFTSNLSAEDIKDLHEVLPITRSELSDSMNIPCQKLDKEMSNASVNYKSETLPFFEPVEPLKLDSSIPPDAVKGSPETECKIGEYSVLEQEREEFTREQVEPKGDRSKAVQDSVGKSPETNSDVELLVNPSVEKVGCQTDEPSVSDCNFIQNDECTKESIMKELELALSSTSDLMKGLDSQEDECDISDQESNSETELKYSNLRKERSQSLDDITESVANEFFDMLGIDHSPFSLSSESETESPRERLLRQFEKDCLASGSSLLDFDVENDTVEFFTHAPTASGWGTISDDFHNSAMVQDYEERLKIETEAMMTKTRATILEDLETEALMDEWGLNERAFQHSPPSSSGGFGSPIDVLPQNPQQLPPLAEGLGPFVQTKNGGFLRSMNPVLFRTAKNRGSLIMQASSPVVVPAEMGSSIMDILQGLASVGVEKLSMQANRLMPLEDITGKTMQQLAWETVPSLEGPERPSFLQHENEIMQNVSGEQKRVKETARSHKVESNSIGSDAEYVPLEDLAPSAMDKIEALSIEGLRIQSGMSNEDAPSNISPQNIGEFSALKGNTVNVSGSIGLDGTGGLQLLDVKDNGEDINGLMGLSLTLDEWMKLDSGEINDGDLISEQTSKILAAHHATSLELFRGRSKGEKRRGKVRKFGLLGNNFTVALMVQLRDPLRNYEPVGTPMLALIQVERVLVAPKPKIYHTIPKLRNCDEEDQEEEPETSKIEGIVDEPEEDKILEEELVPQYKVTEVHVAGLKAEPGKKKLWGSSNQQQSGSRWLLANGMGKKNKHPLMKSKAVAKSSAPASSSSSSPVTTTANPGDTLWSISSRVHGNGAKWKELAALNPHIRNPNVIFPNETIRLH
ncbi:protein PLASTID MOVEMENT IMPAIRED 1-RELATED 1-like [Olea europaea var. sylvestris]|uniref:protein PLASTID MOVEMENT IMPAIRED 1-RELATED 1-like n=1 Tax=Olea europaea var. sylvestris TaxID=158386 RepID=UPI000C1CEC3A|nr:protein PLASTID MOVEMENT IMPAIRED 1-RELATED 1-like [Olea europaea var. sylvestris]